MESNNLIPKIVFQTWKTKQLPPEIEQIRKEMQDLNPDYEFCLYDDADIIDFLRTYSPDEDDNDCLLSTYEQLTIGAAKADFWRYLVLFKYGGIYLDIDSSIIRPLDELFMENRNQKEDSSTAIITRETNKGIFNNWILIFPPNHILLHNLIQYCVHHINKRSTNDIIALTGPVALTSMLHYTYKRDKREKMDKMDKMDSMNFYDIYIQKEITEYLFYDNLYYLEDEEFNKYIDSKQNEDLVDYNTSDNISSYSKNLRVYKTDMGEFAIFKHRFADKLYSQPNTPHWRDELSEKKTPFI